MPIRWRTIVLVVLAVVLAWPPRTGSADPPVSVAGWVPYWAVSPSLDAMASNGDLFTRASPFWYFVRQDGDIGQHDVAGDATTVRRLRAADIAIIPTITSGLSPAAMHDLLADDAARADHVAAIVDLVDSHAWDGIDINYEQFAVSDDEQLNAANRDAFSEFVAELCNALAAADALCSIVVMARVDEDMHASYRPELAVGVYDYAAIAAHADVVRVMGYDQHWPEGEAGPIAGMPWLLDVLEFAQPRIPNSKLVLGIPTYGRDWGPTVGERAAPITDRQAVDKVTADGIEVSWDDVEREPHFTYSDAEQTRTVWWSNAQAVQERVELARERGLAGVAFWTPGYATNESIDAIRRGLDLPAPAARPAVPAAPSPTATAAPAATPTATSEPPAASPSPSSLAAAPSPTRSAAAAEPPFPTDPATAGNEHLASPDPGKPGRGWAPLALLGASGLVGAVALVARRLRC